MLWVEKYRPIRSEDMVANSKARDDIRTFLAHPPKGTALLLAGPPGVGKSLAPVLIARELQLAVVELNASDERSKEDIESYASATRSQTLFARGKVIIMDEVDGLSSGDRGGISAMAALIKASRVPIILIASDAYNPKLRPLRVMCQVVKFTKVPSPSVEKFLRDICKKENVTVSEMALKSLARFSQGDLRAAVTDLQMACIGAKELGSSGLEAIGFRERESSLYDTIPTMYRSGSLSTVRRLLWDTDKDPDEVFWWLEQNVVVEHSPESISPVLDTLARADVFRGRVVKQQNWSFKGYMVDLMAGVTLHGKQGGGYVAYKAPDRLILLGRSKMQRTLRDELAHILGRELHCSKKRVLADVFPYLRIIAKHAPTQFTPEERSVLGASRTESTTKKLL